MTQFKAEMWSAILAAYADGLIHKYMMKARSEYMK